jgi:hypothetical protein
MRDITPATERRPFTDADVGNKGLIISMLRHEDGLMLGLEGAKIWGDNTLAHLTDMNTYHIFHRATLAAHGFTTTDEDVATYRTIFRNYYNGPTDYDADVLSSVCYMRENKCVYYTAPPINVGDAGPDVELETLGGAPTSLHAILDAHKHKHVFVGAFSNS